VKTRSRTIPLIEVQIGPDGSVFNALYPVIDAALKQAKLFDESLDAEYRREALMAGEHQRNMLRQASEKMFVPVPPESINVASSMPVQHTPVKRKLAELLEYSKAYHSAIEQKLAKEAAQAQGRRAQKMFVRKHGTDVDTVNVDMGEYTDADRKLARLSLEFLEGKRERSKASISDNENAEKSVLPVPQKSQTKRNYSNAEIIWRTIKYEFDDVFDESMLYTPLHKRWTGEDGKVNLTDADKEQGRKYKNTIIKFLSPTLAAGGVFAALKKGRMPRVRNLKRSFKGFYESGKNAVLGFLRRIIPGKKTGTEIVTSNGIKIKGFTIHAVDRAIQRGVKPNAILDAVKNPLKKGEIIFDKLKRPSQRFIGRTAEVVINPKTGKIISVNPTSSKKAAKLLKKLGE